LQNNTFLTVTAGYLSLQPYLPYLKTQIGFSVTNMKSNLLQ
jgi:hypothetical protein